MLTRRHKQDLSINVEFFAGLMTRPQWFDFWETSGGLAGVKEFAVEAGIKDAEKYAFDLKAYLFRNPDDERKFELLNKLRTIRDEHERKNYNGAQSQ